MIYLGGFLYLVIAIFFFMIAIAMTRETVILSSAILGLLWPLVLFLGFLFILSDKTRERLAMMATQQEREELKAELHRLEKESMEFINYENKEHEKAKKALFELRYWFKEQLDSSPGTSSYKAQISMIDSALGITHFDSVFDEDGEPK